MRSQNPLGSVKAVGGGINGGNFGIRASYNLDSPGTPVAKPAVVKPKPAPPAKPVPPAKPAP
jgi:hypothetical protein